MNVAQLKVGQAKYILDFLLEEQEDSISNSSCIRQPKLTFPEQEDALSVYWYIPDSFCGQRCTRDISARRKKKETFGPCREKTCLRGFRYSNTQTSLLSYRD